MEKRIIVLGGIGPNDRRNRDDARVIDKGGCCMTLKSHIEKDKPMVLKKWVRK